MSAISKNGETLSVAFAALPPDMQVLVDDFVNGNGANRKIPDLLPLVEVEINRIPIISLDEWDRGLPHALAMDLDCTPPIVVAEGHFLDGRHRSHKARLEGRLSLDAIDLSGLVDPHMLACNSMGRLAEPADETDLSKDGFGMRP